MAKKKKRGRVYDDKPIEEKSVLHREYLNLIRFYVFESFLVSPLELKFDFRSLLWCPVKEEKDYQGRSFMHPPQDVGVNLRATEPPHKCFIPKRLIHTWEGHTKAISAIRWFPMSAHLLLSCSMDSKIKVRFLG